jgi:hypothetical protein
MSICHKCGAEYESPLHWECPECIRLQKYIESQGGSADSENGFFSKFFGIIIAFLFLYWLWS